MCLICFIEINFKTTTTTMCLKKLHSEKAILDYWSRLKLDQV